MESDLRFVFNILLFVCWFVVAGAIDSKKEWRRRIMLKRETVAFKRKLAMKSKNGLQKVNPEKARKMLRQEKDK